MKTILKNKVILLIICVLCTNINAQTNKNSHSVLDSIQQKIDNALEKSFVSQHTEALDNLEVQISENKTYSDWNLYWLSYLNYHKSIFYLGVKNQQKAAEANKKSITLLKGKKNKTAEDYALLANNLSLSFAFMKNPMRAMIIDGQIKEALQKGFRLDKENIRLFFVEGNYDFHTPKEYGGGKKAETSLLKALELSDKNQHISHLPNWGKENAYETLIQFYLSKNEKNRALIMFEKLKKDFPKNRNLTKIESDLQAK